MKTNFSKICHEFSIPQNGGLQTWCSRLIESMDRIGLGDMRVQDVLSQFPNIASQADALFTVYNQPYGAREQFAKQFLSKEMFSHYRNQGTFFSLPLPSLDDFRLIEIALGDAAAGKKPEQLAMPVAKKRKPSKVYRFKKSEVEEVVDKMDGAINQAWEKTRDELLGR